MQATDSWVTQFATLLRDRLGPGRKAYIEHGNEIWNGMYGDFQYCINKGVALGYDAGGAGQYLAGLRYHSERSVQIFGIFERFVKRGMSVLLIEQNLALSLKVADRAYVLSNGTVAIEGAAKDLLHDPRLRNAYPGGDIAEG